MAVTVRDDQLDARNEFTTAILGTNISLLIITSGLFLTSIFLLRRVSNRSLRATFVTLSISIAISTFAYGGHLGSIVMDGQARPALTFSRLKYELIVAIINALADAFVFTTLLLATDERVRMGSRGRPGRPWVMKVVVDGILVVGFVSFAIAALSVYTDAHLAISFDGAVVDLDAADKLSGIFNWTATAFFVATSISIVVGALVAKSRIKEARLPSKVTFILMSLACMPVVFRATIRLLMMDGMSDWLDKLSQIGMLDFIHDLVNGASLLWIYGVLLWLGFKQSYWESPATPRSGARERDSKVRIVTVVDYTDSVSLDDSDSWKVRARVERGPGGL